MAKTSEFRWVFGIDVSSVLAGNAELMRDLSDFRPVWPKLAPQLGRALARNAVAGVGRRPALSAAYKKRKRREGYGTATHVRTHTLVTELRAGRILDSDRLFVSVGLEGKIAEVAAALNFGTPSRKSDIPARPFFEWTPEMQNLAFTACERHVDEACERFNAGGAGPSFGAADTPVFGAAA